LIKFHDYNTSIDKAIEFNFEDQALSIFQAHVSEDSKDYENKLLNLHCRIAESYLKNDKYNDAEKSFTESNFDPIHI